MTQHLGLPIPSPALFGKIGQKFRRAVASFAEANGIPWVRFAKDARKADVMAPYLKRRGHRPVWLPDAATSTQGRMHLVRQRTRVKNRVHASWPSTWCFVPSRSMRLRFRPLRGGSRAYSCAQVLAHKRVCGLRVAAQGMTERRERR
jgi:hypothetical protein